MVHITKAHLPPIPGHPIVTDEEFTNLAAFLVMIMKAEGTAAPGGYGALFGWPRLMGRSFDPETAADHPRKLFPFVDKAGRKLKTSAAGGYQITKTTWDDPVGKRIRARYGITNFNQVSQDLFTVGLLENDGALLHIFAGRLGEALSIAKRRWASLPGAGYDQPERPKAWVIDAYLAAGGKIVETV